MSRSQYGPAAGTKQGAAPRRQERQFPELTVDYEQEDHLLYNVLRSFEAAGVYRFLTKCADYETGAVLPTTYASLLDAGGIPPSSEKGGRHKAAMTYEQLRRILRELESVGLVERDPQGNAAQGQLRLFLPMRARITADRKQRRAQHLRQQGLAQAQKARKAA